MGDPGVGVSLVDQLMYGQLARGARLIRLDDTDGVLSIHHAPVYTVFRGRFRLIMESVLDFALSSRIPPETGS